MHCHLGSLLELQPGARACGRQLNRHRWQRSLAADLPPHKRFFMGERDLEMVLHATDHFTPCTCPARSCQRPMHQHHMSAIHPIAHQAVYV